MAITFTQATGGPVPKIEIEINLAGVTGATPGEKDLWFLGEGEGGTLADDAFSEPIGSVDDAIAQAGDRSVLQFLVANALDYNNVEDSGRMKGRIFLARLGDVTGAAATQTLTFVGNASKAGVWVFAIGRKIFRVSVQSGDTPTQQAARFKAVYDEARGHRRLPITATPAAGVVTLTATAPGTHFNSIALEVLEDPGITTTATFSESTLGGGVGAGTGTHDGGNMDTLLGKLLTQKTRRIVPAFRDDASIEELITHINNKADAISKLGGQVVVGAIDTRSALVTLATGYDDGDDAERVVTVGASNNTKSWEAELSARGAAADSSESETARSLNGLQVTGLHTPDDTFNQQDLQVLIENGVTPVYRPAGDDVQRISRWVMTATRFGVVDAALIDVLDVVRDRLGAALAVKNNRASIVPDNQVAYKGFITQPKAQRAIMLAEFKQYERDGLLTGVEDLFEEVQLVQPDPNTLQVSIPTAMVPQLHNQQIRLDAQVGV